MTNLEALLEAIDRLPDDQLEVVYRHIEQRRHPATWVVPPENLRKIDELMRPVQEEAAQTPEEEVNRAIDEAIAEVRRARKNQSSS
jgi:hypothetical protein